MQIRLIRSATMRWVYAGRTLITDPYLAARHAMPSYTGASLNPLVELPIPPEEVLEGVELAVISHLHSDHFDPTGQRLLPKCLPIVCQPGDAGTLADLGFGDVIPARGRVAWRAISIERIEGQHGSGEVLDDMGDASGFVLQADGEPTVYWVGDTIWTDTLARTIDRFRPEVIITHSGGAQWGDHVPIIMDELQTVQVCLAAPESAVVAVHMEALDHQTVTREDLRRGARAKGVADDQLHIPLDGESLTF